MTITPSEAIVWIARQAGIADGSYSVSESMDAEDIEGFSRHLKSVKASGIEEKIHSGVLNYASAIEQLKQQDASTRDWLIRICEAIIKSDGTHTPNELEFVQKLKLDLAGL
jgi:hypothetical protein